MTTKIKTKGKKLVANLARCKSPAGGYPAIVPSDRFIPKITYVCYKQPKNC